ncbi:DUF2017 domain-containing protein [Frigoribacterium sp. 2-23]|uniref:DUF2017 domain-containing protein n=1 Tax=Frigoribacterium sp. 2-23 TaxID=3415006 RepID=UPI003C6F7277
MSILPFGRVRGDGVRVNLAEHERTLLADLTRQVVGVLEAGDPDDPAVARLLPDAYRGDDEAAAEFRRFTADDLTRRKIENASVLLASLETEGTTLDRAAQQSWLRTLTDLRLTLGSRLGVTADGFAPSDDPQTLMMHDVFDWLGYLQEVLVRSLPRR